MCFEINPKVKSLKKRTVWKVFDTGGIDGNKIVSLYQGATYPKNKLIERSSGDTQYGVLSSNGLYFYVSKVIAKRVAASWDYSYIAKFSVDPKDFLVASLDGEQATYERATRVGPYIRVG